MNSKLIIVCMTIFLAAYSFIDASITPSKIKVVKYEDSIRIKYHVMDSLNRVHENQKNILILQHQIINNQLKSLKK